MNGDNITPTHTATITDTMTGAVETVNLYAVPANLTPAEFEAFLNNLIAKVVA